MLAFAARHGKACLVAGLLAGLLLPGLASAMRPWLPELVGFLLFLTAFRIGPRDAVENLGAVKRTGGLVLFLQLALPVVAVLTFRSFGVMDAPLALAVALMLAAPSVTGTPNFLILLGHDPAPAMRLLVLGTAMLPVTVLPVLALMPDLGGTAASVQAAGRLLAVILGAAAVGFALRHWRFPRLDAAHVKALDGAMSISLAVVVVALMSAVGPALTGDPVTLLWWLLAAFAVNFGFQVAVWRGLRAVGRENDAIPAGVVAGNRNIALFLVALPAAVTDPLLIFIGCYQFPMYLTPILLERLYGHADPAT